MRVTGDRGTGRLLGLQLFGHRHAEIAKRIDIAAAAIFNHMTVEAVSDLDLSYTPPLGSPWDAVQMGAQAWLRATRRHLPAPDCQAEEHPCQGTTQGPAPAAALLAVALSTRLGWWWADPAGALVIAVLAAREGIESWQEEQEEEKS